MPPQMRPRSMTMTDLPRWQSSYAVDIPAIPEPITATSHSCAPSSTRASGATSISIQSDLLVMMFSKHVRTFSCQAEFQFYVSDLEYNGQHAPEGRRVLGSVRVVVIVEI